MGLTFVSGWAGFPALFPHLPPGARFLAPFAGQDEAAVLAGLEPGGDALVAWSMGAHLVLRHRAVILPRFARVVLAAGFLRFTDFTPARVLRLMRRGLLADPAAVVRAFHDKCGVTPAPMPDGVAAEELAAGLDFLAVSAADPAPVSGCGAGHVLLVHGLDDAVVPPEAAQRCLEALPGARLEILRNGHFLPLPLLLEWAGV